MNSPPETDTRPDINSHHEVVVAQVAYNTRDTAKFLGVSYFAAQRLLSSGAIRARNTGARYIVPGAAIIEYLDGRDEPLHHKDTA